MLALGSYAAVTLRAIVAVAIAAGHHLFGQTSVVSDSGSEMGAANRAHVWSAAVS